MAFIRFYNFNDHGYGLYVAPLPAGLAHLKAKDSGGYLVEINDSAENDFIKGILNKDLTNLDRDLEFDYADKTLTFDREFSIAPDGGGGSYIWTGGTDFESEGTWLWRNSRRPIPMDRPEWGSGAGITEPDNSGGIQHHLGFGLSSWPAGAAPGEVIGFYGEWNDIDGTNRLYSLIEYDYNVDPKFGFKVEKPAGNGNIEPNRNPINPVGDIQNTYARVRMDVTYNEPVLRKPGKSYDYNVYYLGNDRYGLQLKGEQTIDEITGCGKIVFGDGEMSVNNHIAPTYDLVTGKNDITGQCFRLYSASFTRLPDPSGLDFWIDANRQGRETLLSTAEFFSSSPEFKDRYGDNISDREYITTLYKNVLGRTPDESGFNFWENAMGSGESRGGVLGQFSESAENQNLFSQLTGIN